MNRLPRRSASARRGFAVSALLILLALPACAAAESAEPPTASRAPVTSPDAQAIADAVERVIGEDELRAAIVEVRRGDDILIRQAWGESMATVPAVTEAHFRSGAMSIPQISTVLLQLAQDGDVSLDDPLAQWLPDVPHAERVTLGQLAQMTSGYPDYVHEPQFVEAFMSDPFRQWTPEELYGLATDGDLLYEPGTNWNYAHTDYVLLGLALERILDQPLDEILQERILGPLDMTQTADPGTPEILSPVLHAFDSERKAFLGIDDDVPFIEDSTFWNPSWTLARGAIQNTDIRDMATLIQAIGRGTLLDEEWHERMIAPTLRGQTTVFAGCATCRVQDEDFTYGYGIVLARDWLVQNPLFHGFGGFAGYLPGEDVTIAVAATYLPGGFAAGGSPRGNPAAGVFREVAQVVAPQSDIPPVR